MALRTQNWLGAGLFLQEGPALPGPLRAGTARQVSDAISQLNVDQIFGAPGATNVQNIHGWRIDRQNTPAGFVNICVQKNGVGAPSTVASVFVPTRLNIAPGPDGPGAAPFVARLGELKRKVRAGLLESFATYQVGPPAVITRREVVGEFSA